MDTSKIFKTAIRTRFSDMDAFGHVNNAVYLTFFEEARFDFFETHFKGIINWKSEGLILARAEIDFIRPVTLHQDISCECWCSQIGNKSFRLEYLIKRTNGQEELVCKGNTTLVAFNYDTNQSIPLPLSWKEVLAAFGTAD